MKLAGFVDEVSPDLDVQISVTRELGWSGIEMRNVRVHSKTVHFDDVDDETFVKMHSQLEENGIKIISYGSQIANWSRKITSDFSHDKDELSRIIPRMQKSGTKLVRVMSYPNDGWPVDAWRKEAVKRLKELVRMAEDGGVVLAHENCSGYGNLNANATLDLVSEMNSPAFGLIFDSGNFWETGYDSFEFFKTVRAHIVHIHIKDYKKDEKAQHGFSPCYPGEGGGKVQDVLSALKKDGYSEWYSLEPHLSGVAHEGTFSDATEQNRAIFMKYAQIFNNLQALA